MKSRTPRQDAGYGLLLLGNGQGDFDAKMPYETGLYLQGEVVNSSFIQLSNNPNAIVFIKNKGRLQFISTHRTIN